MMHDTIWAIIQLFVTYQQEFCQLYPVSVYRGVTRSVHSEFAVCGSSLLTVHVAIPVRDADAKNSSSVKKTDETNIYFPLNKMDDYFYMVIF